MPPKVDGGDVELKICHEALYQLSQVGNKPDMRAICAQLGLSHETWRKKFPKLQKEYEAQRGATIAGAPTPPRKTAAKAPTSRSGPLKRAFIANPSPNSKRQKLTKKLSHDDEEASDAENAPIFAPISTLRPQRAVSVAKGKYAEDSEEESDDGVKVGDGNDEEGSDD